MSPARRASSTATPLTVIGHDIEDDETEGPTVLATDLRALGISPLTLVTPTWEQPEGVGDADTAPQQRSPVAHIQIAQPPLDPARTFPAADELEPDESPQQAPEPEVASEPEAVSPPTVSSLAPESRRGISRELITLLLIGNGVVVLGVVAVAVAAWWALS